MRSTFLFITSAVVVLSACSHVQHNIRSLASTEGKVPDFSGVQVASGDGLEFHFVISTEPTVTGAKSSETKYAHFIEDTQRIAKEMEFIRAESVDFASTRFAPAGKKASNVGSEALVLLEEREQGTGKTHLFRVKGVISEEFPAGLRLVDSRGIEWFITTGEYISVNIRPADLPIPRPRIRIGEYLAQRWLETGERASSFERRQLFERRGRKLVLLTLAELEKLPPETVVESVDGFRKIVGKDKFLANFESKGGLARKDLTSWGLRMASREADLRLIENPPRDLTFDPHGRLQLKDGLDLWRLMPQQVDALLDGTVLYNSQGEKKVLGVDFIAPDPSQDVFGFSPVGFKTPAGASAPGGGESRVVKLKQNDGLKNKVLQILQRKNPREWTRDDLLDYAAAKPWNLAAVLAVLTGVSYGEHAAEARHEVEAARLSEGDRAAQREWVLSQYPKLKDVMVPNGEQHGAELLARYKKRFGNTLYMVRPRLAK